ncbi:hypothetical protein ASC66_04220 [Leifsonia sp. Root4]|nr:hypothetical protein ASC66_04220 [Leifsonia sp. Root4]
MACTFPAQVKLEAALGNKHASDRRVHGTQDPLWTNRNSMTVRCRVNNDHSDPTLRDTIKALEGNSGVRRI